jgi:hypothetical protein
MVRAYRPRAGRRLRKQLDAALAAASRDLGAALEFTETELLTIAAAQAAADRGEVLRRLWDERLAAGDAEPAVLVKISAEARQCERAAVDLVGKVSTGVVAPKSERHVRAIRARWDRRDAAWAAARDAAEGGTG